LAAAGGSGTYDMALDTAARLGNTSAKAMRFARALNRDVVSTDARDIVRGLAGYGRFDTRGYEVNIPKILSNGVSKTVSSDGKKIRLSLPSHTNAKPRQFIIEPQGNN